MFFRKASLWTIIIRVSFFLLFCLTPFLLTPWNYELFEYNKMMGVYLLTTIIMASWLIQSAVDKKFTITRTPLDIPIGLFVTSQLVSALFSIDPHISWFGYYSRFNGGMASIFSYTILYYAFVTHFIEQRTPETGNIDQQLNADKKKKNKHNKNTPAAVANASVSSSVLPRQTPIVVRLFALTILSGVIIGLYAVAERLGIDKHLWVQDVQSRVFSSLGQPNWLAAYVVALLPLTMAFFVRKTQPDVTVNPNPRFEFNILGFVFTPAIVHYLLTAGLFFFVLICTRSRSGFSAFAAVDVLFWIGVAWTYIRGNQSIAPLKQPFILVHILFALIIFFNGSYIETIDKYFTLQSILARSTQNTKQIAVAPKTPTGPLLETGGTESGTIRKFVWQAAIDGWKATPKNMSIGTGTETFAFAFYQYKPIGHNLTSEWDFLYNKAHNEYLNYLTTTGLFGLGSYMLLLIGMGIVFVQSILRNPTSVENGLAKSPQMPVHSDSSEFDRCASQLFVPALFAGWVSILITNFFGFSVVVVQLYLFLFPALAFILMQKNRQTKTIHIPSIAATSLVVITACLFVFVIYRIGLAWVADRTFAVGYRLNRVGSPAKAYPYMTQAIAMIPDEPLYRDERASLLSTLSLSAIDSGQATLAAQLAEQAVTDNQTSLMISPNNVNYWKTRTKVLYAMTPLDPAYLESAITSLEHAASLSPNDPKIAYNLGVLAARAGKSQEAETYLLRAKELKPNYRDVYKGLYLLYTQLKNIAKARDVLTWYLNSVDSNDVEFPGLLKNLK